MLNDFVCCLSFFRAAPKCPRQRVVSLSIGIGMGYVPLELARPDTQLEIEIRGKRSPALVVARPIYRKAQVGK
ncbi:MAG TPA: glycine cleavage T C-terminal barrel domain-containing protein [Verrucomicrobiae bacterium]|nr:glycine cleavage T C-terminal barrel domain-containing protein [Verrucomicrobiae bacterium]